MDTILVHLVQLLPARKRDVLEHVVELQHLWQEPNFAARRVELHAREVLDLQLPLGIVKLSRPATGRPRLGDT